MNNNHFILFFNQYIERLFHFIHELFVFAFLYISYYFYCFNLQMNHDHLCYLDFANIVKFFHV